MKLTAEVLESREVPAAFWWAPNPANPVATVATNWQMAQNGPAAPWNRLPGYGDDLYFQQRTTSQGAEYADFDCHIPLWAVAGGEEGGPPAGSPDFAGIHLVNGYSKTVNLQRSPTVGTLELASAGGKIAQNDPATAAQGSGGTLTVTASLNWTDGSLNYGPLSPLVGQIHLAPGATGTAAPTNHGTVSLGSTLRLLGTALPEVGSALEIVSGTYHFVRGAIEVGMYSTLVLAPVPKLVIEGEMSKIVLEKEEPATPDGQGVLHVQEKATLKVKAKNRTESTKNLPAQVVFSKSATLDTGGRVELSDRAQLYFDPDNASSLGYYQRANFKAVTQVEAGCSFVCKGSSYVNIDNGHLRLVERRKTDGTIDANQPDIVFDAPTTDNTLRTALRLSKDADIQRSDRADTVWVNVTIKGHFDCNGNVEMYADRTDAGKSDKFVLTGKLMVGEKAKVTLWWLVSPNATAPKPAEWGLIESSYSGAGDAITAKPGFELKDPDDWSVALDDYLTDNKKEFKVKRS